MVRAKTRNFMKDGGTVSTLQKNAGIKQIGGVSVILDADFPPDSMGFAYSANGQK